MRRWNAYQTFLFIRVIATLAFVIAHTTNTVYHVVSVGLNPLQLVLVGTTLEISAFLFEIPTGVLADAYSRRLSVIIGYFLIGIGFIVESIPTLLTVLLAQVIWGIGYTFISGAENAWIVDEVGTDNAAPVFIRGEQVAQIASFGGIIVAIVIAMLQLNLPLMVGGGMLIGLSLALMLVMPERGFQRTPASERESWGDFFGTLRDGFALIRVRHALFLIVMTSLCIGLFSEGWDRLWTAHLINNITLPTLTGLNPIIWFGILSMVSSGLSLIATLWLQRRNLHSHRELSTGLLIAQGIIGAGVIAFAWAPSFWIAFLLLCAVSVARTISDPLYNAWINNHIESNVRATVLSVSSQANAIGQIAGGPAIGYIGTLSSLRIAISLTGMLILPALWLIARIRQIEPAAE
jgi:DHA3 family tetracycline resistance protein-like MFS transporter